MAYPAAIQSATCCAAKGVAGLVISDGAQIKGTDVVTLTDIEADSSALAGIKDDMSSTDNDHAGRTTHGQLLAMAG